MNLWFILLPLFGYCIVGDGGTISASSNIPPFPLPLSTEDRKEFVCRPQRKIQVRGDANELPDWLIRRYGVALEYNNARRSCCLLDVDVMVLRSCVDGNRRSALDTFCNGEISRDPDRRHPCCYSLSSQRYLCFKQYHDYAMTEGSTEKTQTNNEVIGALTQSYVDRWCVKQAILDIDETSVDMINGIGGGLNGLSKDGEYCCRLPGRFRLSCFQMKMQAAQDERCHVVDDVCCHVTGEERYRCFLKKGNEMKQETEIETTDVGLEPNETLEESIPENDVTEADDVIEEDDDLIEENPEESDYFLEENRDSGEENIGENDDDIEETSRDGNERVRFRKEHSDVIRENNTTAEDIEDSIEQENENLFIVEENKSENSTAQENYDVIEENSGGGNNGNAKHRKLKPNVRSKIQNNGRPKSVKRRRNRLKGATMLRRCCLSGRNQHNNNTCTIGTAIEYTSSMKIIGRRQRCAIAYYRCCKQAMEKTVTSQVP